MLLLSITKIDKKKIDFISIYLVAYKNIFCKARNNK